MKNTHISKSGQVLDYISTSRCLANLLFLKGFCLLSLGESLMGTLHNYDKVVYLGFFLHIINKIISLKN